MFITEVNSLTILICLSKRLIFIIILHKEHRSVPSYTINIANDYLFWVINKKKTVKKKVIIIGVIQDSKLV